MNYKYIHTEYLYAMDKSSIKKFSISNIKDLSLWILILGNLLSIYMAYKEQWPLTEIMWIYWVQSLIIGLFNASRMLKLKTFYSEDKEGNRKEGTISSKLALTSFFIVHYGFFHYCYAQLLGEKQPLEFVFEEAKIVTFIICVIGFACSHAFSFFYNDKREFKESTPNINQIMMYPYKRIIPMHLTIILGGIVGDGTATLMLFMCLKTYADIQMHILEHKLFRKP